MATTIKLKNSVTTTNAPSSLAQGEVAINITDKKVWVGNAATTPIQLLGDGGSASFGALSCTTLSASGVATFSAGTVSAPAITTTGDTNTGIFFPAADTIAFTEGGVESMRIDSSGNVGIGTSSPSNKLDVAGIITASGSPSNPTGTTVSFYNGSGVGPTISGYQFAVRTGGTPAETMRIDNNGNVGIGTSSPNQRLQVNSSAASGGQIQVTNASTGTGSTDGVLFGYDGSNDVIVNNQEATATKFFTSGSERMRITSDGNLLVGTTTDSARLTVTGSGATGGTWSVYATNSTPTQTFGVRNDGAIYLGLAAASPYNNTTATAANCVLVNDGFTARSTSALKYKQDIRDLENININKFRPVRYKSKCINDDQTKDHFGIVADEVHEAGITELVNYGADGEIEGFQYERLTVVLLKAIQELNAKVVELEAKLNAK